jgi:beta-xylosidase
MRANRSAAGSNIPGRKTPGAPRLPRRNHVSFEPRNFQQTAGLVHYYNRHKFHYLAVTWHEELGRALTILSCPGDWPRWQARVSARKPVALPGDGPVELAMDVDGADLQFHRRLPVKGLAGCWPGARCQRDLR